ncbi:MAG: hypothetical protein GY714_19895 [Desulfobacterales bacterium]|nr:hypothetical protein [Desulfobacterales bacterium]
MSKIKQAAKDVGLRSYKRKYKDSDPYVSDSDLHGFVVCDFNLINEDKKYLWRDKMFDFLRRVFKE